MNEARIQTRFEVVIGHSHLKRSMNQSRISRIPKPVVPQVSEWRIETINSAKNLMCKKICNHVIKHWPIQHLRQPVNLRNIIVRSRCQKPTRNNARLLLIEREESRTTNKFIKVIERIRHAIASSIKPDTTITRKQRESYVVRVSCIALRPAGFNNLRNINPVSYIAVIQSD